MEPWLINSFNLNCAFVNWNSIYNPPKIYLLDAETTSNWLATYGCLSIYIHFMISILQNIYIINQMNTCNPWRKIRYHTTLRRHLHELHLNIIYFLGHDSISGQEYSLTIYARQMTHHHTHTEKSTLHAYTIITKREITYK